METLTPAHAAAFEAVVAKVPMDARNRIAVLMDDAAAAAAASAPHWDFDQPGHRAEEALAAAFGPALTDDHRRALVASWALELPTRIVAADLPQAVLELYPEWIGRLAGFLSAAADPYDRDALHIRWCVLPRVR